MHRVTNAAQIYSNHPMNRQEWDRIMKVKRHPIFREFWNHETKALSIGFIIVAMLCLLRNQHPSLQRWDGDDLYPCREILAGIRGMGS